ncbi:serine/threonine protein kinase [Gigaspora margarita]|uniref:Serine/threonine protein kinase n=1 Tax=Gigaspora margarita TaxID=4874 RepID=A0A8H4AH75_GIGMA|nr:serine/threonine protein kinase [Gigaspora margarita]
MLLDYDSLEPTDKEHLHDLDELDFDINDYLNTIDYMKELDSNPENEISEFIRNNGLTWIPYEKLTNIEYLAHGGFSVISKAKWKSQDVVLKCLNNSKDLASDILQEITYHPIFMHERCIIYIAQCRGISQDPATGNYLMVMNYFKCVAYELLAGQPPYFDVPHDISLTISICNGLRPNLDIVNIPQLLKSLIIKCWDSNPLLRPEANELLRYFVKWYYDSDSEFLQQCQQMKATKE